MRFSERNYSIESIYYLSEHHAHKPAMRDTGLSYLEIEEIVGRFAPHSQKAGHLRGKVVTYVDGRVEIRTSFGNKLLWRAE